MMLTSELQIFHHLFKLLHELLSLIHTQAQGRQQTDYIGTRATREAMLLLDKTGTRLLIRNIQFYAYHQALTTYICHMITAYQFL